MGSQRVDTTKWFSSSSNTVTTHPPWAPPAHLLNYRSAHFQSSLVTLNPDGIVTHGAVSAIFLPMNTGFLLLAIVLMVMVTTNAGKGGLLIFFLTHITFSIFPNRVIFMLEATLFQEQNLLQSWQPSCLPHTTARVLSKRPKGKWGEKFFSGKMCVPCQCGWRLTQGSLTLLR